VLESVASRDKRHGHGVIIIEFQSKNLNDEECYVLAAGSSGSAHSFGFAIYSAASGRYQDSRPARRAPSRHPREALDTTCTMHLTDPVTSQAHSRCACRESRPQL